MGNLSSSQLKVATHTHTYNEVGISAGQNITIDNGEISAIDTTYSAGTGLSLSNGEFSADTTVLQEKLTAGTNIDINNNTISATDTTYTAGTGLTLSGTQFAVDTTTIATKADIANLGSFTVVDTLPAVGSADEKTIYLLGPIGTGADKYEEWIVTESETSTSGTTTDLHILVYYDTSNNRFQCQIVSLNMYEGQYIILDSFNYNGGTLQSISYNNNTYTEFPVNVGLNDHSPNMFYVTFDTYSTDPSDPNNTSASGRVSTSAWTVGGKVWTKIGETSIDLSGYATTTALTNGLATKQDTLTASDGIDIDGSNNISVDVTDIIGTGLSEDANNNIIVDTTVVATQTDLSGKQDKATSGSTAPSTTPSYVGQQYVDTTADKLYVATGTSSSSDWTEVGAGGSGSGDMQYSDFNWVTKTGATITLDLNSVIEPSANFTVNAPATIKDGQIYVLRVISNATAYTMTLGTNITNPYSEDLTLTANTITQFSFIGIDSKLELQPSGNIDMTNYLAKNNVVPFTPSGDYNPATKGYVDNKVSNYLAKDNTTEYTPSANYNPATKKYVDDNVVQKSATAPSSPVEGTVWYDTTNDILKAYDGTQWNATGKTYTEGNGIDITNDVISADLAAGTGINISNQTCTTESDRKGPCPSGFHVPSHQELSDVSTLYVYMRELGIISSPNIMRDLKAPNIGTRAGDAPSPMIHNNGDAYWWTSEPNSTNAEYGLLGRDAPQIRIENRFRAEGMQIRPFRNTTVEPTSSWTVIQGTLGSVGIFWNQTDGLISIGQWSSNVWSGVTMADKNLGATTVWNYGDTATEANSGKFYQWGNNYGFVGVSDTSGETITTTTTQVDASSYGPGNYYSNNEFYVGMYGDYDWSSVQNDDLWGDTSNSTHQECTTTTTLTISSSIDISSKQDKATSGSTAPATTPTYVGQQYIDTTNNKLYVATGTTSSSDWTEIGAGGGITIGTTAPSPASAGMLWYDTTSTVKALKGYDGSAWKIIGPEIVPISQSDYDLLSSAEKNNGKFYLITNASGTITVSWSDITSKPSDLTAAQIQAGSSTTSGMVAPSVIAASMPRLSTQTGNVANLKIWVGTQAAYEALSGNYDSNTLYFTTTTVS